MLRFITFYKLRRLLAATLAICVLMTVGGCTFGGNGGDDLYKLPKVAGFVSQLQTEIDAILAQGGEYAAPMLGVYRQSVQIEDLDADGVDEAVVFVKMPDSVMRVCLFRQDADGDYYLFATADKEGTSFETASYVDLNGDGSREILVGRSVGSGLPKALSVLSTDLNDGFRELLAVTYSGYTTFDLGGDGMAELVLVRHDMTEHSGVAEAYRYSAGDRALLLEQSAAMSGGFATLKRLRTGKLVGGEPAIFLSGENTEGGISTDIFAYRGDILTNITYGKDTEFSWETVANYTIWGGDLNSDGIFDLPMPVTLSEYEGKVSSDTFRKIIWRNYDISGRVHTVFETFHNNSDGWYFIIPDTWTHSLTVDRRDNVSGTSGERSIVFMALDRFGKATDLLAVYTLTGDNRVDRSELPGRFVVSTAQTRSISGTIYAAKLFELPPALRGLLIGEEQVAGSFKLIQTEWLTGELIN